MFLLCQGQRSIFLRMALRCLMAGTGRARAGLYPLGVQLALALLAVVREALIRPHPASSLHLQLQGLWKWLLGLGGPSLARRRDCCFFYCCSFYNRWIHVCGPCYLDFIHPGSSHHSAALLQEPLCFVYRKVEPPSSLAMPFSTWQLDTKEIL